MDSARFLLAILLMIAVIVVTNLLFPPVPRQPAGVQDTAAVATDTAAPPPRPAPGPEPPPAAAPAAPPALEPAAAAVAADTIVIESPLYRYAISTAGGGLVSAELLQFESFTRDGPVQLVPPGAAALLSYAIRGPDQQREDLSALEFRADPAGPIRLEPGGPPQP